MIMIIVMIIIIVVSISINVMIINVIIVMTDITFSIIALTVVIIKHNFPIPNLYISLHKQFQLKIDLLFKWICAYIYIKFFIIIKIENMTII